MEKDPKKQIKFLFIIRVILWIVALVSTGIWMWYQDELYKQGIYDPYEYASRLRPVLYTCLGISVAAVCAAFILHAITVRIKKKHHIR